MEWTINELHLSSSGLMRGARWGHRGPPGGVLQTEIGQCFHICGNSILLYSVAWHSGCKQIFCRLIMKSFEAKWCQKNFKWWIRHKFPLLRTADENINQRNFEMLGAECGRQMCFGCNQKLSFVILCCALQAIFFITKLSFVVFWIYENNSWDFQKPIAKRRSLKLFL